MKQRELLERLLFVSRVREPGAEPIVRQIVEERFPQEAFERAGMVGFTVYIGGGYCIFEFGFENSFEEVFARAASDSEIADYFDRIGRYVDPAPRVEPGATAAQPIAADVFMWRTETGLWRRESTR